MEVAAPNCSRRATSRRLTGLQDYCVTIPRTSAAAASGKGPQIPSFDTASWACWVATGPSQRLRHEISPATKREKTLVVSSDAGPRENCGKIGKNPRMRVVGIAAPRKMQGIRKNSASSRCGLKQPDGKKRWPRLRYRRGIDTKGGGDRNHARSVEAHDLHGRCIVAG